MAFDLGSWKQSLGRRLNGWWGRAKQIAPDSAYAALSAAALLPLVETARRGDLTGMAITLGGVVSGIGANLIANQVQQWKDRAGDGDEVDIARWVGQEAARDPAVRDALDAILTKLDAIGQARAELDQADLKAFHAALRADLERLGNLPRFQAKLRGSGAIAQARGRAVAASRSGVAVGGGIRNSLVAAKFYQKNVYVGRLPRNRAEALAVYGGMLERTYQRLPLADLDPDSADPTSGREPLELARVYIDLDTMTRVPVTEQTAKARGRASRSSPERETRPVSALEATAENRALVILGDPGSGKSTFLNHLTFCLASHLVEPRAGWRGGLERWSRQFAGALPIPVILRDFASSLADSARRMEARHLWDFTQRRLNDQKLGFVADHLERALDDGTALVLLDGLDEIPTKEQRERVRQAIAAFMDRYASSRYVLTCRTLAYQDPAVQLAGVPPFQLAPFDPEHIDRFIAAWYAELGRLGQVRADRADDRAARLRQAVRRPDLSTLALNPLLLTVIALVHTHKGVLPDARAKLYEETIEILLWRREDQKAEQESGRPRLRQLLDEARLAEVDLKRALSRLAFEAHAANPLDGTDRLADIDELRLLKALAVLNRESLDWAQAVVDAMKLRAGLLLERAPGIYTFPHRTFQEYLAGTHLASQSDFGRRAAGLLDEGVFWRQSVLLAVGRLVHVVGDLDKPLALVGELCPAEEPDGETSWRKVWIAGEALVEVGAERARGSRLGRDLLGRVQGRLTGLLHKGRLSPVERASAGAALARLGDPRFRADAWHLPDEPLLGFVEVAEGPFWMGSDPTRDPQAPEEELPQRELVLPTFYMGRYPVTVAQFKVFVKESGHVPGDPDSLRGLDNHPVVWVSWDEAVAYCRWLTERLQAWPQTPEPLATLLRERTAGGRGWRVTLPSEAEWEKAARGPKHDALAKVDDRRLYPWGDDPPDPDRANYDDTGIGATSAVGSFPRGRSPYKVEELSGNVWEWTRSLWGKDVGKPEFGYPYRADDGRERLEAARDVLRVLRGGSFLNRAGGVRCAARRRNRPNLRDVDVGFRVVVSPFASDL